MRKIFDEAQFWGLILCMLPKESHGGWILDCSHNGWNKHTVIDCHQFILEPLKLNYNFNNEWNHLEFGLID